MKRFALLSGSLRDKSYNTALLQHLKRTYGERAEMAFINIGAIPMYDPDQEEDMPEAVRQARSLIQESDAVIISTPEYNHSISGALKNALDWFSRGGGVLKKKPVLVMGCSTGPVGTSRAQNHLRLILNSPGIQALTLPSNEILVNYAQAKFDEAGTLTDTKTIEFIDGIMDQFFFWVDATADWRKGL